MEPKYKIGDKVLDMKYQIFRSGIVMEICRRDIVTTRRISSTPNPDDPQYREYKYEEVPKTEFTYHVSRGGWSRPFWQEEEHLGKIL